MKLIRKGVADKIRETFSLIKHEMQQNSPDFLSGKDFLVQQRKLSDILAIFPKLLLKRILICCFFLSDENLQLGPADIYQSSKSCLATLQNVKL